MDTTDARQQIELTPFGGCVTVVEAGTSSHGEHLSRIECLVLARALMYGCLQGVYLCLEGRRSGIRCLI